jgi:hypothetical protein
MESENHIEKITNNGWLKTSHARFKELPLHEGQEVNPTQDQKNFHSKKKHVMRTMTGPTKMA